MPGEPPDCLTKACAGMHGHRKGQRMREAPQDVPTHIVALSPGQGVMSPSPSGALGDQQYRQLSMARMPSMGMGKLESMELPDAVAAVAMLHDMPAEQQRGAAGGGGGGTSAGAQADTAKQPAEAGGGPPASNGLGADGHHVRRCRLLFLQLLDPVKSRYGLVMQDVHTMQIPNYCSLIVDAVPQRDNDTADMPAKREAPEAADNPEQALMDQVAFICLELWTPALRFARCPLVASCPVLHMLDHPVTTACVRHEPDTAIPGCAGRR